MNRPKVLKIYSKNYARTGYGKEDITERSFLETVIRYNEDGNLSREEQYLDNNEISFVVVNEYDDKGNLILTSQYDAGEELIQQTESFYNEEKTLIKQNTLFGEGAPVYSVHFVYENGLLVKEDAYDDDQFLYTEKQFLYNAGKQPVKQIEYDEDGNQMYVTVNDYNSAGLLMKKVRDEILAKDRRTYIFDYDDRGNKLKELVYDYDDKLIAKAYYVYNEDNQCIEKEEEDLDNYQKTINSYEGANIKKTEIFDSENQLRLWTEYLYDDDHKIVSLKNYVPDETDHTCYRLSSEYTYEREY